VDINTLFLLFGGILALIAAFGLFMKQAGTVRRKNTITAFSLFPLSWVFAVLGYFLIGFTISYGYHFFSSGEALNANQGYQALRFFFLSSLACLIPAIISGSLAERATLKGQIIASTILVALIYPLLEGTVWGNLVWLNGRTGLLKEWFNLPAFHDLGGAVILNLFAGFAALGGVLVLGPRLERYIKGKVQESAPSSPVLAAIGNWIAALCLIGIVFARFSGDMNKATALAPMNVLLGIAGGAIAQFVLLKEEWHIRQGSVLAGAISVLAGADVFHPLFALASGFIGGILFLFANRWTVHNLKLDDTCGAWPLHGLVGAWGGIAAGIGGYSFLGGLGGVNVLSQLIGTLVAAILGLGFGLIVFLLLNLATGLRTKQETERLGMDIALLKIALPEEVKKK
jgi:Amt family ammonium transporter